jgi:hypothetical protein
MEKGKEYLLKRLIFESVYKNGKRNGKAREYLKGEKNGKRKRIFT